MMKKVMLLSLIAVLCIAGNVLALPAAVAHWPLDGDAQDISGNNYHGTLIGSPAFVPGIYGDAMDSSGGGYADVPEEAWNENMTDPAGGFTVCWWEYTATSHRSITLRAGGGRNVSVHCPWVTGGIIYDVKDGTGYQRVTAAGLESQWQSQWVHWTLLYTPGRQEIYLNGGLEASGTGTAPIEVGADFFTIGSGNGTYTLNGQMDDVRVYNIALTVDEIAEAMAGATGSGGGAHSPDPTGTVISEDVPNYTANGVSWEAPLTNSDPNGDPNLVSVNGYDVYWSAGVEPNYLIATPVVDYNYVTDGESYTPTTPIDYDTTYYWRVDTYVTWDSNEFTGTASLDSIVEGSEWQFTTEPAYTPVQLDSFASVITTVDIGTADLVVEISGNSTPVTAVFEILTDDHEYPVGGDAVLSNYGPSASLTTTLSATVDGTYKVRATVTDSPSTPPAAVDSAIAVVVVYADGCQAAKDVGGWTANYYDQDDDCDVDVNDLRAYAINWLNDTSMAAQETIDVLTGYTPADVYANRIETEWAALGPVARADGFPGSTNTDMDWVTDDDPNMYGDDPNSCTDHPMWNRGGAPQLRLVEGTTLDYADNVSKARFSNGRTGGYYADYKIDVPVGAVGVPVDVYCNYAANIDKVVRFSSTPPDLSVDDSTFDGVTAGATIYAEINLPSTGGYNNYYENAVGTKIGQVTFTASGVQRVRMSWNDPINFDWISFDW